MITKPTEPNADTCRTYVAAEVVCRVVREAELTAEPILNRADLVVDLWRTLISTSAWYDPNKECVVVFILNRRNRLVGYNLVSLGSASGSMVRIDEEIRDLTHVGVTDECFVSSTLVPLRVMAAMNFENLKDQEMVACHSGHCFL